MDIRAFSIGPLRLSLLQLLSSLVVLAITMKTLKPELLGFLLLTIKAKVAYFNPRDFPRRDPFLKTVSATHKARQEDNDRRQANREEKLVKYEGKLQADDGEPLRMVAFSVMRGGVKVSAGTTDWEGRFCFYLFSRPEEGKVSVISEANGEAIELDDSSKLVRDTVTSLCAS
ncbi:MAG: hypothetical protein ACP5UI_00390 [Thermoprotei archaeon]|nr:hypothetical protein [TACK group archaeon]